MIDRSLCPVCENTLKKKCDILSPNPVHVSCPNCGHFLISNRALKILPNAQKDRAVLSYNIRKRGNSEIPITTEDLDNYLKTKLPSPLEQIENML